MASDYCLRVIRLEGLQWKSRLHRKDPNLYVEVKHGQDIMRTRTVRRNWSPAWNDDLIFTSLEDSATLGIQIKHDSFWPADVGYANIKLVELLARCTNGNAILTLFSSPGEDVSIKPIGSIVLRLQAVDRIASTSLMIHMAGKDVQQRGIVQPGGASKTVDSIDNGQSELNKGDDLYQAVGDLLSRLDTFKEVIDVVSEIHPFFTIAWKLTSGLLTAASNVFRTDRKVVDLVRTMEGAFDFVRDAESLPSKTVSLQQAIVGLLKQTIECCLFIRQYTSRNFAERVLDLDSSRKVDELEQSLANFKKEIDSGVNLYAAFVSLRISQRIDEILLRQRLNPTDTDTSDRTVCLAGTRMQVQKRITEWIFSEAKECIFWLHGVAGSGKSTVSMTIAEHLRGISRLGCLLAFERGKGDPSSIVRTIAYKLALFDSTIGSRILSETDGDKDIVSASLTIQFDKLILRPLAAVADSLPGPIVIILDALDECGTAQSRQNLLRLLQRDFAKLPNNFRFLITSRREPDIDKTLSSQPDFIHVMQLDNTSTSSQEDVLSYLRNKMNEAVKEQVQVPESWPWDENIGLLGKTAGGLFIWASTAVRMVKSSDDPFGSLQELVSDSASVAHFGLDELYASVLRNSGIAWAKETSRARFAKVLALVLLSKIPLSSKTIDGLLGFPPEETSLLVLSRLGCLLSYSAGQPVRLLHTSFSDYLVSSECANDPWFINLPAQRHFFATRCFSIMKEMLHFNMCDLDTSFVYNDKVSGLEDRIRERIPSHLEYACLHWVDHLSDIPFSLDLLDRLSDFSYRSLLFWFEVVSLRRVFRRLAGPALLNAAAWVGNHDEEVSSFLSEASKLASEFALPISQSTPHVYISALSLTMDRSEVSKHYTKQFSSGLKVTRRGIRSPPKWLKVLEGHSGCVSSVAVSTYDKRIASASEDKTVRIWNIDTGEEILPPLIGHSDIVWSLSFSPDGTCLVSGSRDNTLRIWDAQGGKLIRGPLQRHEDGVLCAAYSANGKRIASGSDDQTIIIWDATTGGVTMDPLKGHTGPVHSVAFSPDGTKLTSGSSDKTIRVWNVESGELVFGPLEGHTDWVVSVTFSPDGKQLASGSWDDTIRVWDVESGSTISGPFCRHTEPVASVAYSPCGIRIVSGSSDKTIIVWDARSGEVLAGPLEGHGAAVCSVTFTPDGKHIVSGSHDRTIRTWDSSPAEAVIEQPAAHRAAVWSVAYYPDGSRIASASIDNTIIVWDARTGEVVAGPFEGHTAAVYSIAFSLDGKQMVTGSRDATVKVWSIEGREVVATLEGHTGFVYCVIVSQDGTKVVSCSGDKTIRVWDMTSGKLLAGPLHGHSDSVVFIASSSDDRHLASGSWDKTIRIWDTRTWETISEPLTGHTDRVNSVCFSPDGTRLASGSDDETVIVWDVKSCQIVAGPFRGHTNWVLSVIFSIDGRHVLAGYEDGTIRIWDIENGRTICEPLEGHTSDVMSLALSPDGTRLASGSHDNTVRVWDISAILQPPETQSGGDTSISVTPADEGLSNWVRGESGWIVDGRERRNLLMWIPPDLRGMLWLPRNTAVCSEFSTRLDFTEAALGERWSECFKPATLESM